MSALLCGSDQIKFLSRDNIDLPARVALGTMLPSVTACASEAGCRSIILPSEQSHCQVAGQTVYFSVTVHCCFSMLSSSPLCSQQHDFCSASLMHFRLSGLGVTAVCPTASDTKHPLKSYTSSQSWTGLRPRLCRKKDTDCISDPLQT